MIAPDPSQGNVEPEPTFAADNSRETEIVAIDSLLASDSPRLNGTSVEHIKLLASSEATFPPILVHRDTLRVIDGMHRLQVARQRGQQTIEVKFFDGTYDETFVKAVEINIAHGLPLTLADRRAAATRIIAAYSNRSDRWIASVTGLAAGTVAAIRRETIPTSAWGAGRTGRDGKVRPVSSAVGRRTAHDALTANPDASLREIARTAGISPATVRDVRDRMRRGEDPVASSRRNDQPIRTRRLASARHHGPSARDRATILQNLRKDPSLRLTDSGRSLLRRLEAWAEGPVPWHDLFAQTPSHAIYLIAEFARSCSEEWQQLAVELERRSRGIEQDLIQM